MIFGSAWMLKPVDVEYTEAFLRQLRQLSRRYRHIRDDVQPIIMQLQSGETPGDQIPNVGFALFKVRVRNRNIQKGKSAGYRLIYYLKDQNKVILVTIYSKSDQSDIDIETIRRIISNVPENEQHIDPSAVSNDAAHK
jgi:mRNA-degrading endonuclease RelE of RelBE toxin-antitoxin system